MPDPSPLAAQIAALPHVTGAALRPSYAPAPRAFAQATPLRMPTMLVVEDSRYACEVLRLYTRALGLRLRRAADLETAQSHLRLYRPDIVLVDLGLPDGRGEGLIAQLAKAVARPPLLIAVSGESGMAAGARDAGADVFIEKPMPNIAEFRAMLVDHFPGPLPMNLLPDTPRPPQPDPIALHDDLQLAASVLQRDQADQGDRLDLPSRQYWAGFLRGVGGSLGDAELQRAAHDQWIEARCDALLFAQNQTTGDAAQGDAGFRQLRDLVNERLRDVASRRDF